MASVTLYRQEIFKLYMTLIAVKYDQYQHFIVPIAVSEKMYLLISVEITGKTELFTWRHCYDLVLIARRVI
jgi:hypothetical protein